MKLTDLQPRWLSPNVFVFWCPHCQKVLLSCKNIVLDRGEQDDLFERECGDTEVVPCNPQSAWKFESNASFETLSVTPSLDASGSGHWHGFIASGQCT